MPWGRIDDGFYDHPKLDRLGKDKLHAVGLHWLAVSWCNRWLTDGHVTTERVTKLGGTVRLADLLVAAELWERDADGYLIHDFLEFNEAKADVEAAREAEREKKRRQRAGGAGKAVQSGAVVNAPGSGRFVSPHVSPGDTPRDSLGVSPQVSPSTVPLPSRPDHTRPDPSEAGARTNEPDRHGLPNVDPETQSVAERVSGRSLTTLHGFWATELDRLIEDRGAVRVQQSLRKVGATFPEKPSWPQLIAGVRNDLEPLPSSGKPMSDADRKEAEIQAAIAQIKAETKAAVA